jgi:hypothetical protein
MALTNIIIINVLACSVKKLLTACHLEAAMFLPPTNNHNRFDLLLLGDDEYYLSDESVVYHYTTGFAQRFVQHFCT